MNEPDVIFFCGKGGFVHVNDKHDDAATAHLDAMNRAYRARCGEFARIDQQCEWLIEGREASELRAGMRERGNQ